MKKIFFVKTTTVFVILLSANVAEPLVASEAIPEISQNKVKSSSLVYKVSQKLKSKGLDPDVALSKASAVFSENLDTSLMKLHRLQTDPELSLDREKVIEILAKRALFEKPLKLDCYDSVTGFVQEIKGYKLTSLERESITKIL